MLYAVIIIIGFLVMLLAMLMTRAVLFQAKGAASFTKPVELTGDADAVAERLAGAIRYRTIAHFEQEKIDGSQFHGLHEYLKKAYPQVAASLQWETVADYSLMLTWKGTSGGRSTALLAHLDVVPVTPGTECDWKYDAFSGFIDETHVWGRGAIDMKGHLICVLEAVESLLAEGFRPAGDVYLCFGHNEEIVSSPSSGAHAMMEVFRARGINLDLIIDEGGVVIPGEQLLGIKGLMGVIGTAEKGYMDVRLSCAQGGGHSSQPPKTTALGILAKAATRLESNPMPPRLIRTVETMLTTAGKRMSFGKRLIFANIWLFKPLLIGILSAKPITNAMVRTTAAITMANGSPAPNVLPQKAELTVNTRILPGETMQTTLEQMRKIIADDRVLVECIKGKEPSAESSVQSEGFRLIGDVLNELYPGIIISPYLMIGGTDSYQYEPVCGNIFRIAPFQITNDDLAMMHGTNERITKENLLRGTEFFRRILKARN